MKIINQKYNPNVMLNKVAGFMDMLQNENIRKFSHDFKTSLHCFFSVTDPFVGLKIGESAKAGAFDWSSEELSGLNSCLREGFDLI